MKLIRVCKKALQIMGLSKVQLSYVHTVCTNSGSFNVFSYEREEYNSKSLAFNFKVIEGVSWLYIHEVNNRKNSLVIVSLEQAYDILKEDGIL